MLFCLSLSLRRCRKRGTCCGRKEGYPCVSFLSSSALTFYPPFHPTAQTAASLNRWDIPDYWPAVLTSSTYLCVCVCVSWGTNGMPLVSTAEKSMTTQPFHLRNPMKGWAAAHVCLRMFMFAHTTHKLVAKFKLKYAYLSANPHQRRCCLNLEASISAG